MRSRIALLRTAGGDGTVTMVAKVAIGPLAAAQGINEARILDRLAAESRALPPARYFSTRREAARAWSPSPVTPPVGG